MGALLIIQHEWRQSYKLAVLAENQSITLLLRDFAAGDKAAIDQVIPLVYAELRRIADRYLHNESQGHTLQPTALVHELYARMVAQQQPSYQSRAHFLGVGAQVMRQILIDHARSKRAAKRDGGRPRISLDEACNAAIERPSILIEVDDAISALAREDAQKAQLIEMRFFGGLTAEESAEVLGLPVHRVRNQLRVAQAWLQRELDRGSVSSV
jgi:RNA polymerase sigma factor (TIGR02999 family)